MEWRRHLPSRDVRGLRVRRPSSGTGRSGHGHRPHLPPTVWPARRRRSRPLAHEDLTTPPAGLPLERPPTTPSVATGRTGGPTHLLTTPDGDTAVSFGPVFPGPAVGSLESVDSARALRRGRKERHTGAVRDRAEGVPCVLSDAHNETEPIPIPLSLSVGTSVERSTQQKTFLRH
jgi:hypothetical protein